MPVPHRGPGPHLELPATPVADGGIGRRHHLGLCRGRRSVGVVVQDVERGLRLGRGLRAGKRAPEGVSRFGFVAGLLAGADTARHLGRPPDRAGHAAGGRPDRHAGEEEQGHQEHCHEHGDRPEPSEGRAERICDEGTHPAPGRRELGRGRPEGWRAAGQAREPGHGEQGQGPADDGSGRLAAGVVGVALTLSHHEAHADRDQHQRQKEPALPEEVAGAQPGAAAGRAERTGIEGHDREGPDGDQHHTPEVGCMPAGNRSHRRQETGPPVAATLLGRACTTPGGRALPRVGGRARSRRGCRPALRSRSPRSTRPTLGGGRHSAYQATPAECR